MAAPRVLQVSQRLRPLLPCVCSHNIQFQQVRHKKGTGRFKAPVAAKEKEKWIPRSQRMSVVKKVIPRNWEEKFMSRVPLDDVWFRAHYPPLRLSFADAMERHTELVAAPEMMNSPQSIVHMEAWLDMTTKKKTKFMVNITSSVILPNNFDDGQVNRVIVFTKTEEEQQRALELGAVAAGYADVIRNLASGDIGFDDYEHAICLHDMLPDITNLRKFMKDKFPSKGKGSLGENLEEMLIRFRDGKVYTSTKEDEGTAKVQIKLGTLSMGTKLLEENFQAYVAAINSHKAADQGAGQFISKAVVTCPPSQEKFHIRTEELASKKKPNVKRGRSKQGQQEEEEEDEEKAAVSAM